MTVIKRKNDPSPLQLCRKRDNGFGIDQRLVHEKNPSALNTLGKSPYPGLNGRTHSLLVIRIENNMRQMQRGCDLVSMMTHHNDDVRDSGASRGSKDVFEKHAAPELKEGLGTTSHTEGLAGCQYDCGDQWDSAYMNVFTAMRYA